jgi:hypothetical protein
VNRSSYAAALIVYCVCSSAQATIVTATYTGTITSGISCSEACAGLDGANFRAVFNYDPTIAGFQGNTPNYSHAFGGGALGIVPIISESFSINNGPSLNFSSFDSGAIQSYSDEFGSSQGHSSAFLISTPQIFYLQNMDVVIGSTSTSIPLSLLSPFTYTLQAGEFGSGSFHYHYIDFAGRDDILFADLAPTTLTVTVAESPIAAVPEPSTWAMMILGFAGIGFMAYHRKTRPALMAA